MAQTHETIHPYIINVMPDLITEEQRENVSMINFHFAPFFIYLLFIYYIVKH